jgi:two-component system response regulator HydG
MSEVGVLLISHDSSLSSTVHELVSKIANLKNEHVLGFDDACKRIGEARFGLVIAHLHRHAHVAGLTSLLSTFQATGRTIPVLVLSDEYQAEQALTLLRLGAADYLGRPLNLSRLAYLIDVLTIDGRYGQSRTVVEQPSGQGVMTLEGEAPFLFTPDGRMARTIDQIRRIAPLETTILLGGETGTGKTHLANVIHRLSPRRDKPFLTINCGALAANLIESEMFGHVKGAFTGADSERTGKFAAVGRGTLFLDEIDALCPALQAKLLRVVEERAFEPVGSNKTLRLQARLIVASNRPLEVEVAATRFRADLYYRLNVVAFDLPPLRERKDVIPALAGSLLADASARNGLQVDRIAPTAMHALLAHSWPGNIRELRNVVERAAALAHGAFVTVEDLPDRFHPASTPVISIPAPFSTSPATSPDALRFASAPVPVPVLAAPRTTLAESKDQAELALISDALVRNGNNRLRAAAELGISRMTLYKKLHKYGLMQA